VSPAKIRSKTAGLADELLTNTHHPRMRAQGAAHLVRLPATMKTRKEKTTEPNAL
jgi:hypothetical protein